jgi:hypothetical protein
LQGILSRDALFDEEPPFREAEFLLVRLFIAIRPLGGVLFELLAPLPISYLHDRRPFRAAETSR